jgi:c-di-GMP-binding flagellar brake protein YcgR
MSYTETTRRRFPRIRSESPVHIRRLGPAATEGCAKTGTLGLGGCMFVAREGVGEGSLVDLLISVQPQQVIEARGRVVYEHHANGSSFEVGVEFLTISESDRLVLQSILQNAPTE